MLSLSKNMTRNRFSISQKPKTNNFTLFVTLSIFNIFNELLFILFSLFSLCIMLPSKSGCKTKTFFYNHQINIIKMFIYFLTEFFGSIST